VHLSAIALLLARCKEQLVAFSLFFLFSLPQVALYPDGERGEHAHSEDGQPYGGPYRSGDLFEVLRWRWRLPVTALQFSLLATGLAALSIVGPLAALFAYHLLVAPWLRRRGVA
jgi:hypothetical protein